MTLSHYVKGFKCFSTPTLMTVQEYFSHEEWCPFFDMSGIGDKHVV